MTTQFTSFRIVRTRRIFGCGKCADVNLLSPVTNPGDPGFAVRLAIDSEVTSPVVSVHARTFGVNRSCANKQIRAAIVQSVIVGVVNLLTGTGIGDEPMKRDVTPDSIRSLHRGCRVAGSRRAKQSPRMHEHALSVNGVNNREFALGQRDAYSVTHGGPILHRRAPGRVSARCRGSSVPAPIIPNHPHQTPTIGGA